MDIPWKIDLYSKYHIGETYPYVCLSDYFITCIPYNDETAHLLGTTEEAPEKYKTW